MAEEAMLGAKVRGLRRREGMTQVRLAERLGISSSYLNLIENHRRPLTAPLLLKIAEVFEVDLRTFAASDDARLMADLMELFADPMFESQGLTNGDVRELAVGTPGVARSVLTLYRRYRHARESAEELAGRLQGGDDLSALDRARLPSEEVSDLLQRHMNHFPGLETGAEALWREASLDRDELFGGLCRYLQRTYGIRVEVVRAASEPGTMRRYLPEKRLIRLSEQLPPRTRNFQLAHQVGLIAQSEEIDRVVRDENLTTADSRKLARVALANYYAGAVLMPYLPFLEAARAERYDIELLGHRFRSSFEQVCHRLTTLRRPGAEGVPFHFVRVDIAGNISKRFSASGIRFARFSGACPRWNLHTAFLTPGMIRVQFSRMPDGEAYFCMARTVRLDSGGYNALRTVHAIALGCRVEHAKELVYADGMDLRRLDTATPVGVACRMCDRLHCEQRAFPPVQHPLRVDENFRGVSFYMPSRPSEP